MKSLKPEAAEHYAQALHNYTFFCEVNAKLPHYFSDWKITILFYTSIHLLRAYLAENGIIPDSSHQSLRRAIKKGGQLPVKDFCYRAYVDLYNASFSSRYSPFPTNEKRALHLNERLIDCKSSIKDIDSFVSSKGFPSILTIQHEIPFQPDANDEE